MRTDSQTFASTLSFCTIALAEPKNTCKVCTNGRRFYLYYFSINNKALEDSLPQVSHGPITCRSCWVGSIAHETFCDGARSKIVNDPGYWGSPNPRVLVLGMSKGNTQSTAMMQALASSTYDEVPFKGFRPRLLQVLKSVGLMPNTTELANRMTATETEYGWASIMRCSLTAQRPDGSYSAESARVIAAMRRSEASAWLDTCIRKHLGELGSRTRLVILLSNDDKYMAVIARTMQRIFGSGYTAHPTLGPVVFRAASRIFVHVGHPSPLNGTLGEFLNGNSNFGQGAKRDQARRGVAGALGAEFGRV